MALATAASAMRAAIQALSHVDCTAHSQPIQPALLVAASRTSPLPNTPAMEALLEVEQAIFVPATPTVCPLLRSSA